MKQIFQALLFYWLFSAFSPSNSAMETNSTCGTTSGNISYSCKDASANKTLLKSDCNTSSTADLNVCNNTDNSFCNESGKANGSDCFPNMQKTTGTDSGAFIVVQVTCYAIVFVVGVTGNLLVLLTVTSKRMRSVRNMLIGNLAVADMTTLLICLPLTVIGLFMSWPFGIFICRYVFPITDVVVSVSIITLCVITMDRFRAIVYPFAKKMSFKVTLIVFVIIWLLSYLIVALPVLHLMQLRRPRSRLVCVPLWPSQLYKKAYRLVIFVFLYIIPVVLVFFCFVCIVKRIRENIRFTRKSVRDLRSLARVQRRSRVVRMMFVIFITFTICLLPIHLLLMFAVFYPPTVRWPLLIKIYHISLVILMANSAMNPIILYLLSSEFKRGFKEHCLCFMLFTRIRGIGEVVTSIKSRSLNNQQTTTCLHIPAGNQEYSFSNNSGKCIQMKELITKHNHTHVCEHRNGMKGTRGVETAL